MNREATHINVKNGLVLMGALGLLALGSAHAQVPVDDYGNPVAAIGGGDDLATSTAPEGVLLSATELEELVGPVALYPDDLLAVVLPASTFPLEIVQAARYLERHEQDSTLEPDDSWDESIIALLNYPEVVDMMSDDLDWTWKLGEAVVAQQNELIAAVEAFRDRAYAVGNLKTDEYQTVSNNDGIIEIDPVNDDVIYVPYYEPERVVVYSPRPVYYYYPRAYPVYYYPYAADYSFNSGFFWGVTTAFTIGWATDYLHVYHPSYYGHPYYGHPYYYGNHYWRRPSINVYNNYYVNRSHHRSRDYNHHGDYWRPRHHGGARPGYQVARNTYYSGGQHSDTRDRNYRDHRTDGLAYNGSTRSIRSASGSNRAQRINDSRRSNDRSTDQLRASNRNSTRAAGASTPRPAVQFRQRSNNTYTGSVAPRLERATSNSSRQRTHQPTVASNNTPSRNSDAIRFRARQPNENQLRASTNATSRQSRRTSTSANATPTNRMSFAANNSQRTTRSPARRSTVASSSPQVRRSAPARVRSAPRQTAVRSQPRLESVSRPASPPRQSQKSVSSRPSSARPSSKPRSESRSKVSAGSSRKSAGRSSRSSRKHK